MWPQKQTERQRYYLLPGMGSGRRRKRALFLKWSLATGLFFSAVLAYVLWLMNNR